MMSTQRRWWILPTVLAVSVVIATRPSTTTKEDGQIAAFGRYYHLASSLASAFSNATNPPITLNVILSGTEHDATKRLCQQNSPGSVDITFTTQPFHKREDITSMDGNLRYKCMEEEGTSSGYAIQTAVAIDALVLAAAPNGIAATCISSLPGGGLTMDQIRWIYSNYTLRELQATGWSSTALPNSDDSDSTHYWSELCPAGTSCSAYCPPQEIKLVGPPHSTDPFYNSDLLTFLKAQVLTDAARGERLDVERYTCVTETKVVSQVTANSEALGLVDYALYDSNIVYAASVQQGKDTMYYVPCPQTLQDGVYPLARHVYLDVRSEDDSGRIRPELLSFAQFVLSTTGASLVSEHGFVPLPNVDASAERMLQTD